SRNCPWLRCSAQISCMRAAVQFTSAPHSSQEMGLACQYGNSCLDAAHLLKVKMPVNPGRMARVMQTVRFQLGAAVVFFGLLGNFCPASRRGQLQGGVRPPQQLTDARTTSKAQPASSLAAPPGTKSRCKDFQLK